MSWVQLFKVKNFEEALKKTRKNNFHVDPILRGKGLARVINVFNQVKLPFLWKEKTMLKENNHISPLHNFPKGIVKKERVYFERVLKLRQGIANAKERELKWRQEYLNKRRYRGWNELIKKTMPLCLRPNSEKSEFNTGGGGGGGRKNKSDYVKDVPKINNSRFGRRMQNKVKNLMQESLLDKGLIVSAKKKEDRERSKAQEAKKAEQKKGDNSKEISARPINTENKKQEKEKSGSGSESD